MAIIKRINGNGQLDKIINYIVDIEKTDAKIISGKDCSPANAINKMKCTKKVFNKTCGRQYIHVIQSFKPGEVPKEVAHEVGSLLAESQFKDFEVLIATHIDKKHIHNHFVVNSVSFTHGRKYNASPKTLYDIKRESNRLCKERGLAVISKTAGKVKTTITESKLRDKGKQPWKDDLRECINFGIKKTSNVYELQKYLKAHFGIEMKIQDKNLSFKHPDKIKFCRGKKLGLAWSKDNIEKALKNKQKVVNNFRASKFNNIKIGITGIGSNIAFAMKKDRYKKDMEQEEEREIDEERGSRGSRF